jgi:GNAT superfamily N-acetyltransferase
MHPLVIRPIADQDRETVVDLIRALNTVEDEITGNRAVDRDSAVAHVGANEDAVRENGGARYVAELDGVVIGYLCAVIAMAPTYVRSENRRHVVIEDLVIAAEYRGRGIGAALIAEAEAFTRAQGLRHVLIGHVHGNTPAAMLYEKLGYRTYSIERLKTLD